MADKLCQVQFPGGVALGCLGVSCASIIGDKSSLLKIQGSINHHSLLRSIARPNCQVVIAVFTRCVIDINYVQENNLSQIINTTDLEFIGGDFTDKYEAG